ncbi:polyprenyl synthetase family protein [Nocardia panacis]|uniref:Polyprenyl synthetase family protein n=1 Tax=Nocardia panacis TaxID=2340916 RepID=A0A3A4K7E6_9NOCA|nr:polyprenyl synthetase family protein [Nocardia panacis]RJO70637.1 polyprenyl synthetase family protein [Nocardia panacis]
MIDDLNDDFWPGTERIIESFLDRQRTRMTDAGLGDYYDDVRAMIDNPTGKHFCSWFVYWGWRAAGGSGPAQLQNLQTTAASIEMLHAALLLQDDVLDGSDYRRGQPAVRKVCANRHAAHGWYGDAAQFGDGCAIALSTIAQDWSTQLLRTLPDTPSIQRAMEIFHDRTVVTECGQLLELVTRADRDYTIERALRINQYKNGAYMFAPTMRMGAAIANAGERVHEAFHSAGLLLGEGHQSRNDLHGAFGDSRTQPTGGFDDLTEGKPSLLLSYAIQDADADQHATLLELYGKPHLTPAQAQRIRALLEATGARTKTEEFISTRFAEACAILRSAPITAAGYAGLTELARRALYHTTKIGARHVQEK